MHDIFIPRSRYEILHARPVKHTGWYVCMVTHGGRKERMISEPAELSVPNHPSGGLDEPPPLLPFAPLMPMTPRGRERRGLTPR